MEGSAKEYSDLLWSFNASQAITNHYDLNLFFDSVIYYNLQLLYSGLLCCNML